MTPLARRLARRIRAEGPMSIAEYMAICLTDPADGYYTRRDPLGRAGDFITAPEISQMFGELIGLALAHYWLETGAPRRFVLAELGPGRGTLMADALRAARQVPGFTDAMQLVLVEVSPVLRAAQGETLAAYAPTFADDLSALPDVPLFLIANEFFDALPIRQFVRDADGWRERVVALDDAGALAFGLTPPARLAALEAEWQKTAIGDMVEQSPTATALAAGIGAHIADHGGLALIVDYGAWGSRGDTFQAVSGHKKVDPLARPGHADLTAHVDFRGLADALPVGAAASALTPQGVFLERLGITERARQLAGPLGGEALRQHIAAHRRLTHPDEMGSLFQVLAITQQGAAAPPGLDP